MIAFHLILTLLGIARSTIARPYDLSAISKRAAVDDSPDASISMVFSNSRRYLESENVAHFAMGEARETEHQQKGQREDDTRHRPRSDSVSASTLNELYADLMQSTIEEKNKAALAHGTTDHYPGIQVRGPTVRIDRRGVQSRTVRAPQRRSPTAGSTLNEQYAAMIQAAMEENDLLALDPDNASEELQEELRRFRAELQEIMG